MKGGSAEAPRLGLVHGAETVDEEDAVGEAAPARDAAQTPVLADFGPEAILGSKSASAVEA